MSELFNSTNASNIRKTLLATASALVLAVHAMDPETAGATETERPTVWLEGGWQFESVTGKSDLLVPPLDASTRSLGLPSLTAIENALGHTYGGEGSVSFQPKGSDWVFTASARYGRVQSTRNILKEKTIVGPQLKFTVFHTFFNFSNVVATPTLGAYARDFSSNAEAHIIADFQVGKDIGIGLFGHGTNSIVSVGARYAQMNAKSNAHSYAHPEAEFEQTYFSPIGVKKYGIRTTSHRSAAFVDRIDSLQALGPSLSLKNVTELFGTVEDGQVVLDWGVNAALLFGRQKAKTSHHSTVVHIQTVVGNPTVVHPPVTRTRSRMVTIPNLGGFAGLSYRFTNAKISAGYRADFFFGAKDSGLETRTTTGVGFHGPFATISFGLGE